MTAKDVKGILALLQTEYPSSFTRLNAQQMQAKANLWSELFEDDDPRLVFAAVKAIIAGDAREFAPGVGEIKNRMRDLTEPDELSETQAWALVSKALRNGIYGYRDEFERLPPTVQAAVGRAEMLKEWAVMDEGSLSVISSNFMRGYKTVVKRQRETAMIPDSVKALLAEATKAMLPERKYEISEDRRRKALELMEEAKA